MNEQPPVDQDAEMRQSLIRQIFAADRGKKPDDATLAAYLLALRRMDTPRLARVVERLLDVFEQGDAQLYRVPQPGTLWRVAKELRLGSAPKEVQTPAVLELHGAADQHADGWDINANTFLLNYLTTGLVAKAVHNQKPARDAGRYAGAARTAIFVRWKNVWVRDMREDRELYGGKLDGKKMWEDCMAAAEAELNRLIATEQVAA